MLFSIDDKDGRPIYLQLVNQVKEQLSKGILKPGDELPSVRDLAQSLGINLHTVRSAYIRLRDEGLVDLRLGRIARITRSLPEAGPDTGEDLRRLIRETVTDALLRGLGPEKIRRFVDEALEERKDIRQ